MSLLIRKIANNNGQGLLEAIMGIFIIITGVMGALAISHSSVSSHYEAQTRIIAANLAREGIEAVHNIRDSNWISGIDWDTDLFSSTDFTAVPVFDYSDADTDGENEWELDFAPNTFSHTDVSIYKFNSGIFSGVYVQKNPGSAEAEKTLYKRLLTLKAICYNPSTGIEDVPADSASCSLGKEKIGVRIISEVQWREHTRPHTLTAEDSVYNWR